MSTLIIGAGNNLLGDDSVGYHLLNRFKNLSLPSHFQTLYIGVNSSLLDRKLKKYKKIVVIDGVQSQGQVGDFYYAPVDKLPRQVRPYSVHDITWLEMIHLLGLTHRTYLFGIECTSSIKQGSLSPQIQEKMDYYAAVLYKIISNPL